MTDSTMNATQLKQAVRGGAGRASQVILDILTGDRQIESPIEVVPSAFLTLCFRHDLGMDEHQIFRTAVLDLLNAYCAGDERISPPIMDELLYVVQSSSLPARRRTEVTSVLYSCVQASEARAERGTTVALLNVMADELLVTNFDEWLILYARVGPEAGMPCFFGMAQLDFEAALRWLSPEMDSVDYALIRDFAFPSLLKKRLPVEAASVISALGGGVRRDLIADLVAICTRVYGVSEDRFATPYGSSRQRAVRTGGAQHGGNRRRQLWAIEEVASVVEDSPRERLAALGPIADALPGDDGFFPPALASLRAV